MVYHEDAYWRERASKNEEQTEISTSLSAWITFGLTLVAQILLSTKYSSTSMQISNSEWRPLPVLPVITGLFAISGVVA